MQPTRHSQLNHGMDTVCTWVIGVPCWLWNMKEGGRKRQKERKKNGWGEWVNITFVDWDAHGPADCLAIFKLRRDKEHARKAKVSHWGTWNRKTHEQQKIGEINKEMW